MPSLRPNSLILDQFIRTPSSFIAPSRKYIQPPSIQTSHLPSYFNKMSDAPGLVGSHANYVKGATQEVIGSVTGSQEWQNSGDAIKSEAVKDLRAATQGRDPTQSGYGKAEELAGKAFGCEGMEKEGAASKDE